jgi:hypothetical protein
MRHQNPAIALSQRLPNRAWFLGDQALSSTSNFLILILLAHSLDAATFGAYAIVLSVITLSITLRQGSLGALLLARDNRDDPLGVPATELGSLILGLTTGILVLALSLFLGLPTPALSMVALTTPGVLLQDAGRYRFFAVSKPGLATATDTCWLLLQIVGTITLEELGQSDPSILLAVWTTSGALTGMVYRSRLRGLGSRGTWLKRHWGDIGLLSAQSLGAQGAAYMLSFVIAGIAKADAGALRAGQTLFGPTNILLLAECNRMTIEFGAKPSARIGLRSVLLRSRALLVAVGAYGIALWLVPAHEGSQLLGATWPAAHSLVPYLVTLSLVMALAQAPMARLIAGGQFRIALRVQLLGGSATLGFALVALMFARPLVAGGVGLCAGGVAFTVAAVAYGR